jgi:pimeloyl-ACP methyl ester carboxylesterase
MVADGTSHVQIHGWPDCSAGWRFQIPALLDMGLRVVAPDLMGFGGTVGLVAILLLFDIILQSSTTTTTSHVDRASLRRSLLVHVGIRQG